MKLWRCPTCETGARAPSKLRMIDVRRYCLPCSQRAGVLVQRVMPSALAERARAEQQRKVREAKARERSAARRATHVQSERGQLEAFARMALKLDAFVALHREPPEFKIRLAQTPKVVTEPRARIIDGVEVHDTITYGGHRPTQTSGHAYGNYRFVITAGSDPADARGTILHEIAHCAAGYTGGPHGDAWRSVFSEATRELTGEAPVPTGRTHRDLHAAVIDCVRRWMNRGTAP